jgi:hypothetical protein
VADEDLGHLLTAVRAAENGDFSAPLSVEGKGPVAELAGALQGLLHRNDQMARELVRVAQIMRCG